MTNTENYLITDRMGQLVENAYDEIVKLLSTRDTPLEQARDLVFGVIEETRVALEELRVANEELRQQHDELEETRNTLEQERHHYHDLFNAAPIGYIVTDRDGAIIEANHYASRMLGVPPHRLSGKPLAVYIPVEQRPAFRQNLLDVVKSGTIATWETAYIPRDGAPRDLGLTVAPIQDHGLHGGANLRWLLHDITDQKEAEAIKLEHFFQETFEQSPVGIGHLGFDGRWIRVNQALCEMLGFTREELLALRVQDVAYSEDSVRFEEAHRQIIDGLLPIVGLEMRCLSKKGDIVWTRLGISSVSHAHGHHAYGIAIVSDITESKRIAAAERKHRLLTEALHDTALTLTSTLDFDEVLDQIMMIIGGIFAQKAASIMLVEGGGFCVARAWGYAEPVASRIQQAIKTVRTPTAPTDILEHMRATQKPVILNNWTDHGEWEQIPEISAIRSLIAVPIISLNDVIGGLMLYSPKPDSFTTQEGDMLETFAAHAAVAIQNARAHQQAQLLAAHEERHRLARDLHDAVTQSLFSASIISESITRRHKGTDDPIMEQMEELHLLTRGALAEMRTLLMELRPEFLLKSPLSTQIRQLGDAVRSRKRMEIDFTFNGGGAIPGEVQIAFYRIAQEIFNNIVKHSQASHVNVSLTSEPDDMALDIHDNGVGFDTEMVSPGIGMTNMYERANAIQASIEIDSMPGGGTHVSVRWPIESVRR